MMLHVRCLLQYLVLHVAELAHIYITTLQAACASADHSDCMTFSGTQLVSRQSGMSGLLHLNVLAGMRLFQSFDDGGKAR